MANCKSPAIVANSSPSYSDGQFIDSRATEKHFESLRDDPKSR